MGIDHYEGIHLHSIGYYHNYIDTKFAMGELTDKSLSLLDMGKSSSLVVKFH
jgi:hypothetical protein